MEILLGISLLGKKICPGAAPVFAGLDKYSLVCANLELLVL